MSTKQIILEKDQNGKTKPADALTGRRYQVVLSAPILLLERSYHDESPVVGAAFELELLDGSIVLGNLDKNGQARILNLPSPPKRVRFKPDTRDFFGPPDIANPEYKAAFNAAEAAVLAQKHASGQAKPDAKRKSMAGEAMDWVWGTVQGNFNDQQTTSQIIVDAVISAIPLVGEVTDVRDLIAILLGMCQDPKKREDKWEWLGLVVVLLSLIPVIGGVIKGVGKLLIRALKSGGKVGNAIASYIGALNRLGWGDATVWFKKLDLEKYAPDALGYFRKVTQHIDQALTAIQKVPTWVLRGSVLANIRKLGEGLQEVKARGEKLIPAGIRALNGKLKEIQQQVYEGEWVPVGKVEGAKPKVKTRETESKLEIDEKTKKINLVVKNPKYPPSDPKIHYDPKEGWPDLETGKFNTPKYGGKWAIHSFSGPIRPIQLKPGTKIYRIVDKDCSPAGMFWTLELPKNGKQWREEIAVLDRFNENGRYMEFVVPEGGLVAWEGKVAGQIDSQEFFKNGGRNPGYGQYLEGGGNQLLIDFKFLGIRNHPEFHGNLHAWKAVRECPWMNTNWPKEEMTGINFAPNNLMVERKLGELEIEAKGLFEPFATIEEKGDQVMKAKGIVDDQNRKAGGK